MSDIGGRMMAKLREEERARAEAARFRAREDNQIFTCGLVVLGIIIVICAAIGAYMYFG